MAECWLANMHTIAEMGVISDDSRTGEVISNHVLLIQHEYNFCGLESSLGISGVWIQPGLYSTGSYPEVILPQRCPKTRSYAMLYNVYFTSVLDI